MITRRRDCLIRRRAACLFVQTQHKHLTIRESQTRENIYKRSYAGCCKHPLLIGVHVAYLLVLTSRYPNLTPLRCRVQTWAVYQDGASS